MVKHITWVLSDTITPFMVIIMLEWYNNKCMEYINVKQSELKFSEEVIWNH